jgi:hypothetical protein
MFQLIHHLFFKPQSSPTIIQLHKLLNNHHPFPLLLQLLLTDHHPLLLLLLLPTDHHHLLLPPLLLTGQPHLLLLLLLLPTDHHHHLLLLLLLLTDQHHLLLLLLLQHLTGPHHLLLLQLLPTDHSHLLLLPLHLFLIDQLHQKRAKAMPIQCPATLWTIPQKGPIRPHHLQGHHHLHTNNLSMLHRHLSHLLTLVVHQVSNQLVQSAQAMNIQCQATHFSTQASMGQRLPL